MKTVLNKRQINAFYRNASKDDLNPIMMGAYYDNGKVVATNGHQMIVLDMDYDPANEGKIIHKNGFEVTGKFPNWKGVMPPITEQLNVDAKNVHEACQRIKGASKRVKYTPDTKLLIQDRAYSAEKIFQLLDVLRNFDEVTFHRNPNNPEQALVMKAEGFLALLMPVMIGWNNEDVENDAIELNKRSIAETGYPAIFTIEEAMKFEQFKKVVFGSKGTPIGSLIWEGELLSTFEKGGVKYDVVLESSARGYIHAVVNGISQEFIRFEGFGKYDTLIDIVDPARVDVGNYEMPKHTRTKIKRVVDGKIEELNARIIEIVPYKDMVFEVVENNRALIFNQMTYNGYAIHSLTSPIQNYLKQLDKMENPKKRVEEFINERF